MVPNLPVLKSNVYESLDSFGDRFSVSFATVLDSFGTVLGQVWTVLDSFGAVLDSSGQFWDSFGTISG